MFGNIGEYSLSLFGSLETHLVGYILGFTEYMLLILQNTFQHCSTTSFKTPFI